MILQQGVLPSPITRFVGRSRELVSLAALLADPDVRLITLTGTGGVGKTRLAVEAACRAASQLADGARFVDLAPVGDASLLGDTLCAALGLSASPGRGGMETALAALAGRRMLLVLDNYEGVRDATPDLVRLLLRCGGVRVLVTSRVPTRVLGERLVRLAPMAVPRASEQAESVQLFVERAGDAAAVDMDAVAEACRCVDGLPLAVEIVAARAAQVGVRRALADLTEGASVLDYEVVGGSGRAQTLRNTVGWSYRILTPPAQDAFRCLGVFRGSFTADDAASVCPVSGMAPPLDELCEHALLQRASDAREERFRMLEVIRLCAVDLAASVGDLAEASRRHAQRIAAQVEGTTSLPATSAELAGELRAALDFAVADDNGPLLVRLASAGAAKWRAHGPYGEGNRYLEAAIKVTRQGGGESKLAALLTDRGGILCLQGRHAEAIPLLEEARDLCHAIGEAAGEARALNNLGNAMAGLGREQEARECLRRSLAIRRPQGDLVGVAACLNNLAVLARRSGQVDEARTLLEETLSVSQQMGDQRRAAVALTNLGDLAADAQDDARAENLYLRALVIARDLHEAGVAADVLCGLADIAERAGDSAAASARLVEAEREYRAVDDLRTVAAVREALAKLGGTPEPEPDREAVTTPSRQALRVQLLGGMALIPAEPGILLPEWERPAHRQVFEFLCLTLGQMHRRDSLADRLWPQLDRTGALHALRKALSDTRSVLAGIAGVANLLRTDRATAGLRTGVGLAVDVCEMRSAIADASRAEAEGDYEVARQQLAKADRLYVGPLLPAETGADWLDEERMRLADLHTTVLVSLGRLAHRAGDWAAVESVTARAMEADPCLETACRLRMSVLSRRGRRAEALRVYEACRAALREQLALEPSVRTTALAEQIRML